MPSTCGHHGCAPLVNASSFGLKKSVPESSEPSFTNTNSACYQFERNRNNRRRDSVQRTPTIATKPSLNIGPRSADRDIPLWLSFHQLEVLDWKRCVCRERRSR